MKKQDKTIYYLLAVAAAYYAYKWWKGKQSPDAKPLEIPSNITANKKYNLYILTYMPNY
jgi:hypothetical protein